MQREAVFEILRNTEALFPEKLDIKKRPWNFLVARRCLFTPMELLPAYLCRWFRFAQLAKGKKFRP